MDATEKAKRLLYAKFYFFVDCNLSGVQILVRYVFGSKNKAHDNLFLTLSDIQYIGLTLKDGVLTDEDFKLMYNLLEKGYLEHTPAENYITENLIQMREQKLQLDIDVLIKKKKSLAMFITKKIRSCEQ